MGVSLESCDYCMLTVVYTQSLDDSLATERMHACRARSSERTAVITDGRKQTNIRYVTYQLHKVSKTSMYHTSMEPTTVHHLFDNGKAIRKLCRFGWPSHKRCE